MRLAFPLMLSLLAAAGTLDLFGPDGHRVGTVREGPGSRVDLYDAESRRIGWGRRNADGSVELFDAKGNRVGTITRDGKMLRLEQRERSSR